MDAPQIGYHLSSEEHSASDLVRYARRAEEAGFDFGVISDHFHPWVSQQGHSPFVWSVLGGIAHATERLKVGTGVTAPIIRVHPAIVAHAAATVATMMPGRFFLGIGTGENLNEHVVGQDWPTQRVRLEMLMEAIDVLRDLWRGDTTSHRGTYFTVEGARIFDLPEQPPPIVVAASGGVTAGTVAEKADGLMSPIPDPEISRSFQEAGGKGKPRYMKVTVCVGEDEAASRRFVRHQWPNEAVPGPLITELRLPEEFEAVAELITEERVASDVVCSKDPEQHISKIREAINAGFDHVWVHQVGPNQEQMFDLYEREILPALR
ncbi:MAG: TIGR03557 family F420-dependent LLM class oxidoreductase [Actinomycetota bacterium]|nr:TIGR03557 family F420-dependent LLM class oxidoreductase [Actinomycetota bacterium]